MPEQGEPRPPGDPVADAQAMAARRFTEYVDVWEGAVNRLVASDYHAEDLVDDWFSVWGKWVRDSTALAAVAWRMNAAGTAPPPGGGTDDR